MGSMDRALYEVFGDNVNLKNNQDMTIEYEVTEMTTTIEAADALGYFRAPIGVSASVST